MARFRDLVTIDRSVGTTLGMTRLDDKLTRISGAATLSGALEYSRSFVLSGDIAYLATIPISISSSIYPLSLSPFIADSKVTVCVIDEFHTMMNSAAFIDRGHMGHTGEVLAKNISVQQKNIGV